MKKFILSFLILTSFCSSSFAAYRFNQYTGLQDYYQSGGSGSGDVVGPSSAVDGDFVQFDGTTGKLIKDGGFNSSSFAPSIADPNANVIYGWDDTDNAYKFFTIGSGLTYTHSTHTLSSSGGSGDITSVGDCTTGACFDGTQGTTLTLFNAGGNGTISYDGTNITLSKPILSSPLTASRAVVTDGSKILVSSATTATEIGYVNGVTSAIQTQLDGKQATLTTGNLTASSPLSFNNTRQVIGGAAAVSIADAVADASTKGASTYTAADFNSSSGLISLDYTNGQKASGSLPGFLSSTDWTTFNNKGSGSVTSIATSNGITGGTITTTGTISGVDAIADGATKGVASYTAADFNSASGIISIDYANGQKATGSVPGFLTAADWTTFNGKQAAGNYITALTGDVTASGPGSVAATIANSAVTYAKMQNVSAASKLWGRGSAAGAGAVEEITLGSGITMTGTTLSSSGGSGDITSVGDCASGACFDGTQGTTLTFFNSAGNADITYTATDLTIRTPAVADSANIVVEAGNSTGGNTVGGTVYMSSGNGHGSGAGGSFTFEALNGGATGAGGTCLFSAGDGGATSGAGGNVELYGGDAQGTNSKGGDVIVEAGGKTGSGLDGIIYLIHNNASGYVQIGEEISGTIGKLRFWHYDGGGSHYTQFTTGSQTQNILYTLPLDDGTSGQALLTDGSGVLSWGSASSSPPSGRTATATNYTILTTDYVVAVTSTASARTITLPAASAATAGRIYYLKDESLAAGTNNITLARAGSDTIDGATSALIAVDGGHITFYSDGSSKWFTL